MEIHPVVIVLYVVFILGVWTYRLEQDGDFDKEIEELERRDQS